LQRSPDPLAELKGEGRGEWREWKTGGERKGSGDRRGMKGEKERGGLPNV